MTRVMLSCDEATFLVTKQEFEKLPCMKRMQLRLHLFSCKLCRNFQEQSQFISEQIRILSNIDTVDSDRRLNEEQKNKLSKVIEEQVNSN